MITKDNINALLFIYYTEFKPIITNLRRKHNVQNSIGKTLNKLNPINLIHNKKSELIPENITYNINPMNKENPDTK